MSEIELYGLMAVAKEHQKAVEKAAEGVRDAGERLTLAAQALNVERSAVAATTTKAAQEAAKAHLAGMVGEMQGAAKDARQKLAEAAQEAQGAVRVVSWAWLLAVFGLGLGVGTVAGMLLQAKKLDRIEAAIYQAWKQTPEGQKAGR
jgi:hypothetical protein